jgi:hypothetical protein
MYPTSPAGKVVASITMICGILVIALPVTILGSNFQDLYARFKASQAAKKSLKKKLKRQKSAAEHALDQHIIRIQEHRRELDDTLKQLRLLLTQKSRAAEYMHVWSTVDYVILNGLSRVEQFLSTVDLTEGPDGLGIASGAGGRRRED